MSRKRQSLFYVGPVRVEEDGSFALLDLDGQPNVKDIIEAGNYEYIKLFLMAVDTDHVLTQKEIEWGLELERELEQGT